MAGLVAVVVAGSLVALAGPGEGPQGPAGEGGCGGMCPAGGPMMGGGAGPHGPMGAGAGVPVEIAKKAGATEEQIQKLEAFNTEQQAKRIDLQAAAEKAELKLNTLMRSKEADEKSILEAADAVGKARNEVFKLHLLGQFKMKQILGEEVLKKMHELGPKHDGPQGMRHGFGAKHDGAPRDQPQAPAPDAQ